MTSRLVRQLPPTPDGVGAAAALADGIRSLILDGRLTIGELLPSERALAAELARSRATVASAYRRLESGGYLTRVQGSGTRVALPRRLSAVPAPARGDVIEFTIASMGSAPGVHEATVRALDRVAGLRGSSGYILDGLADLRARVAERYAHRGVPTRPEQIVITSGAMHALTLVLAALGRRGSAALVEQPTFPNAMGALRRTGHRLIPTPVTPDGWDLEHIAKLVYEARPALAYMIPDFHNPTGASMTDDERSVLAATLRSAGALLIADETTTDLDIDRGWTPAPVAAYGPAVHIGSLSKVAWGGLRIGWIRADDEQIARILAARPTVDLGTAPLEQCIAIELFDEYPALQTYATARLRAGRDAVADGVEAMGLVMPRLPGGLSAWVDLGDARSTSLSLAAREHALVVPPGPRFSASGVMERFLRIPITWERSVTDEAMARLGAAWGEVTRGRRPAGAFGDVTVV